MINNNPIPIFVISLPRDKARRQPLERQLQTLGLSYAVADAVDGMALSDGELDVCYDRDKAVRLFNRELARGEIGCALSHVGIYRKMLLEDIPYALILEDDAKILDEDLAATLAQLTVQYPSTAPVAILLNHVPRYNGNRKIRLDRERALYEAYRATCTHGYVVTKAAAGMLLRNLYPIHVVADKWEYFQQRFVDVQALVPYPIGLAPASRHSIIDNMGVREKKAAQERPNRGYYLRRLLRQLAFAIRSRPFMQIERQSRSASDLPETRQHGMPARS